MLAMLNVKLHFPARRGIGLEFVGDHDAWRLNGAFQEFRQEALRRSAVSPFLDQNVENKAVLIDRAPEPVSFAGDGNDEVSGAREFCPRALSEPDVISRIIRLPLFGRFHRAGSSERKAEADGVRCAPASVGIAACARAGT